MKYLLDTHIWLWALLEPSRITEPIAEVLQSPDNELYLSPISIWETLILAEKGRIELLPTSEIWIVEALGKSAIQEAALTRSIALKSRQIDLPHQDPADRFIAATAWEYGFILLTADSNLRQSQIIQCL